MTLTLIPVVTLYVALALALALAASRTPSGWEVSRHEEVARKVECTYTARERQIDLFLSFFVEAEPSRIIHCGVR